MKYMLVRYKVADFDTWKKVFGSHAEAQHQSGQAYEGAEAAGVLDEPDCWYLD